VRSDEILRAGLERAKAECERLRKENANLRLRLGEPPDDTPIIGADSLLDQNKAQPLLNISSLSEIANQHDIADRRPASYGEFFAIARPGETDYLAVCKIG